MSTQPEKVKTAAVFGATGLVGKEILNELSAGDDFSRIVAVVRNKTADAGSKVEQVIIDDFSGLMDLKDQLKADVYFCCIGTTIKKAGSQEAFTKVDLGIPVKIAQLAQVLSVPALVVISSLGADPDSSNFYLRTKGKMEKTVMENYKGNLKFVRPSLLMGSREEFRFGEKLAVGFMNAFGWAFAGPLGKYKGIYARDVARVMIRISSFPPDKTIYDSDELYDLLSDIKNSNQPTV